MNKNTLKNPKRFQHNLLEFEFFTIRFQHNVLEFHNVPEFQHNMPEVYTQELHNTIYYAGVFHVSTK